MSKRKRDKKFNTARAVNSANPVNSANTANAVASVNPVNMVDSININTCPAQSDTVELLFQTILGRTIGNEAFKKAHDGTHSIHYWINRLIHSEEFKIRYSRLHGIKLRSGNYIRDANYRTPTLSPPVNPALVLVTGSCMTNMWKGTIEQAYPGTEIRHQVFNNASELEDIPDDELRKVNFQIVQIPIRSIISEGDYFSLTLSESDRAKLEEAFQSSVTRLRRGLDAALKYNRLMGLPAFVLNFSKPQANPLGLLMPKYDLCNFSHYVEALNRELYLMVQAEKSVFMIDYDEIASTLGKRFIQDDLTLHLNHGSFIVPSHDRHDIYLTPPGSVDDLYDPRHQEATLAIFNECVASYNVVSPHNKIKIVIFDLDGTLWRGVAADHDEIGHHLTEGWPLSILEAAAFLKKRGILLALASKNDPEQARLIWGKLYEKRFPMASFVSAKFSWNSKVDSVAEILRETNLLPGNCLFVDDNPLEREQVRLAFPDIKVIDGPIYSWRRALLWATELQVPYVTDESISRTESIQGVVQREAIKLGLNEEDYLRDLGITVRIETVDGVDQKKFPRALELLNKTNQFNTTGRRWSEQAMAQYFAEGGRLLTADVSDRLSDYGLTSVMLYRAGECSQLVMSCRVFGLRVEFAMLNAFLNATAAPRSLLFCDTGKNPLCRKFLEKIQMAAPEEPIADQAVALAFPADYQMPGELTAPVSVLV